MFYFAVFPHNFEKNIKKICSSKFAFDLMKRRGNEGIIALPALAMTAQAAPTDPTAAFFTYFYIPFFL